MTVVFSSYLRKKLEQQRTNPTENHRSGGSGADSARVSTRRLAAGALVAGALGAIVAWRRRWNRQTPAEAQAEAEEASTEGVPKDGETGVVPVVDRRLRRVGKGWIRR